MEDWSKTQAAEEARQTREQTKTDGGFVSLKDGESTKLVFLKPPVGYRQIWIDGRSEMFDETKHDGKRPQSRWYFSVAELVPGKKEYQPALLDASGETFDAIDEAMTKYGTINVFELKRKGTGTKTKYSCLLERALEGAELEAVQAVEPIDAAQVLQARRDKQEGGEPASEPADAPQAAGDVWQ